MSFLFLHTIRERFRTVKAKKKILQNNSTGMWFVDINILPQSAFLLQIQTSTNRNLLKQNYAISVATFFMEFL